MRSLPRDHHRRKAQFPRVPDEFSQWQRRLAPKPGVTDGEETGLHGRTEGNAPQAQGVSNGLSGREYPYIAMTAQGPVHEGREAQWPLRLVRMRMLAYRSEPLLAQILREHVSRRHLEKHRHRRPHDREVRFRTAVLEFMAKPSEDALV